jgi:NAD(P)-dependent dehydrogenase (short-subunit alcohol dehydrogenase family)
VADTRVVVVTGASAGLGRAIARRFANAGADVALLARGRDGLEGARSEVEAAGRRALVLPTDVASWDEIDAAAERTERELGPIDVWVNNAMVSVFSPILEMQPNEYRRVTEVTYLGVVYGTLAALHRMVPRDRGSIVQVGSALAYRGIPLQSAYCAAKHAVQGFMDSLRAELQHEGTRVRTCMVQLPAMNTPQFGWVKSRLPNKAQPVPPIYQPEVGADAVFWAAHHDRRELWVGVPTVGAILGDRVAPGLLDRYLAATGYESQQTSEPEDPSRPDNLWEPVPGDHGAHGTFDSNAAEHSMQFWAASHRRVTIGALLAGCAALAFGALAASNEPRNGARASEPRRGLGPDDREALRRLLARPLTSRTS